MSFVLPAHETGTGGIVVELSSAGSTHSSLYEHPPYRQLVVAEGFGAMVSHGSYAWAGAVSFSSLFSPELG